MADRDNQSEVDIKVFNAAKLFAEKILFPMMEQFQAYQRMSDFGSRLLEDSVLLTEEVRDIQRFNGLKAMCDICSELTIAIKSTVYLKNNKEEIAQLENIMTYLDKIKILFHEHKHLFFKELHKDGRLIEVINREYFEKVKRIVQTCYTNTETLMTRNKLLFADSRDEWKSDAEIMEEIKKEYTEA